MDEATSCPMIDVIKFLVRVHVCLFFHCLLACTCICKKNRENVLKIFISSREFTKSTPILVQIRESLQRVRIRYSQFSAVYW